MDQATQLQFQNMQIKQMQKNLIKDQLELQIKTKVRVDKSLSLFRQTGLPA